MKALRWLLLAAGLIGLSQTGCAPTAYEARVYAPGPPPRARYEVRAYAPYADSVWVDGYWDWDGSQYSWRAGHYVRARPGYYWVPNRWHRDGSGWRLQAGYWTPRYR